MGHLIQAHSIVVQTNSIATTKALGSNKLSVGTGENMTVIWSESWGNSGNKETLKTIDQHIQVNYQANGSPLNRSNPGNLIPY
jgi:hypothetical protein